MKKTNNPLIAIMKQHVKFIRLPTNGIIPYANCVFSGDPAEEVGISPRSSIDELQFNNPDALLNGSAISSCIENCVDTVQDADGLYISDVFALLLGIKLATDEKTYDIETECPKCAAKGVFSRDIEGLLESSTLLSEPVTLEVSGITVHLRPNTWGFYNKIQTKIFQQQKILKIIQDGIANNELDETDAFSTINNVFNTLTDLKFDLLANNIQYAELPNGQGVIDSPEMIREWVNTIKTEQIEVLGEKTRYLNSVIGVDSTMPVQCSKCNHEWELTGLQFNPSHFFVRSSLSQNRKK